MTQSADYTAGFKNASKRATSFLYMKANRLHDPASRIAASVLAVDLDIHLNEDCDPNNPEAKNDPVVNPSIATPPKDMSEALLQIMQLQNELDAVKKISLNAASSYKHFIDLIETKLSNNGFPDVLMAAIVRECIIKARELELISMSKIDSVSYQDELTVARMRIHNLRRQLEDNLKAMQSASEAIKQHAPLNEETSKAMSELADAAEEIEDELRDPGI